MVEAPDASSSSPSQRAETHANPIDAMVRRREGRAQAAMVAIVKSAEAWGPGPEGPRMTTCAAGASIPPSPGPTRHNCGRRGRCLRLVPIHVIISVQTRSDLTKSFSRKDWRKTRKGAVLRPDRQRECCLDLSSQAFGRALLRVPFVRHRTGQRQSAGRSLRPCPRARHPSLDAPRDRTGDGRSGEL